MREESSHLLIGKASSPVSHDRPRPRNPSRIDALKIENWTRLISFCAFAPPLPSLRETTPVFAVHNSIKNFIAYKTKDFRQSEKRENQNRPLI